MLRDVSFTATPGSHIAIAGTTGAGKTTLVSLLMRFYDPAAGRIELDGVDLQLQIEEGRIVGVGLPGPRTNGQRRVTPAQPAVARD